MAEPINDLTYFKDVLRQAISISDKLTVQTKQKMLSLKERITEYTSLLDRYNEDSPSSDSMTDRSSEELELESMYKEMETMASEIFREIEMVKKAYS